MNGLLHRLRAAQPATFFDIVSGQNGFTPSVPGFGAVSGYDRASGLGVPRFDRLAGAHPAAGFGLNRSCIAWACAGYPPDTRSPMEVT